MHQGPLFIKCSDFKSFKAGVFDKVTDIKGFDSLDTDITVFTSEVVEWELEVRCFVLNGKTKTFSSYWRDDVYDTGPLTGTEQQELFAFFSRFMQRYEKTLPEAIVLDFGIIREKCWALIEANPAWCSGLYACDAETALEVIVESCIKNTL